MQHVGFAPIQIYELWDLTWSINEKMKNDFFPGSVGTRGEGWKMLCNAIFCVCKANLLLTPLFLYFGINTNVAIPKIEYANNIFYSRIKLMFQQWIWKIWIIFKFFVTGESEELWLTTRTCCGLKKSTQNMASHQILSLGF